MDTCVVISALRSRLGASNLLMTFLTAGRVQILASPPLFLEYEDVLLRPEHRLVHGLSVEQVDQFLFDLAFWIAPVEIRFQWRPQVVDPADEMVLEAAINGYADALVTHNTRHFQNAASRFGVAVLTPKQALRRLRNE